jgi:hypothetical protein
LKSLETDALTKLNLVNRVTDNQDPIIKNLQDLIRNALEGEKATYNGIINGHSTTTTEGTLFYSLAKVQDTLFDSYSRAVLGTDYDPTKLKDIVALTGDGQINFFEWINSVFWGVDWSNNIPNGKQDFITDLALMRA